LGNDVAGLDRVAFFLVPLGEVALLHGGRQRGHQYLNRHRRVTRWRPSGGPARDWSPPTSPPRPASAGRTTAGLFWGLQRPCPTRHTHWSRARPDRAPRRWWRIRPPR